MENQYTQGENSSLFSLQIDPLSKSHLYEAARWGRLVAIVGFIICVLIALGGIFFGTYFTTVYGRNNQFAQDEISTRMTNTMTASVAILYVLVAILYFFPCLFLYRFSAKMRIALNS